MSLSNTKNAKYHCRTSHLETGFNCTSEGILQADIHEMVVTLIRTYAAYAVSLEHLLLLQKERIQAEKSKPVVSLRYYRAEEISLKNPSRIYMKS